LAATEGVLLDILNKTADYFKSKGIENYRLDAQLLLGHVLGMKRLELYMNFDRPLDAAELARYRELVKRRAAREPLQHLLGTVPFRELTLKCDKRALIPRQETEIIVDLVRKKIEPGRKNQILDIGVGAGSIYLSLKKETPQCEIFGVDISADCIALAKENAELNSLNAENLFLGDALSPFAADMEWDIIVSNPPYIGKNEIQKLQPEVRDHDPVSALLGGEHGWEFPLTIIEQSFSHLKECGHLILEIADTQFSLLKEKSKQVGWKTCISAKDLNGAERFILFQK